MKWVGIVAALLSFGTAVYGVVESEAEMRERGRVVAEAAAAGNAQKAAGDYAGAWASLEKAGSTAEADGILAKLLGGLSKERASVRAAQEDLAMVWLRAAHTADGNSFSEVADRLVMTLTSGAHEATGARKADLLAHLGWAYFLKGRSGDTAVQPEVPYREAVAADAPNPYANVFWGHWILWNNGRLSEAVQKFSAALSTGRVRADVRHFQLAALANVRSDATDAEWLRVVNAMHKDGEAFEESTKNDLYQRYYFALNDEKLMRRMLDAVPAADQNELQKTLLQSASLDLSRKSVIEAVMTRMSAVESTAPTAAR